MFNTIRKNKLLIFVAVIVFVLIISLNKGDEFENPIVVGSKMYKGPIKGEPGIAMVQEVGWTTPVKLPVSDDGWEDSTYITRDGRYVLFFYHPTPHQFNKQATKETGVDDGRIYFGERPFTVKNLHPVSKPGLPSDGGPYIAENGDFYYMRTFFTKPLKIVRNAEILDLETGGEESNPHYCDARGELYFDAPDGHKIAVYKNGNTTFLPVPINLPGTQNFQAFLTDDCQTMYFTSTRGAREGILPLQVYKSQRLGEFSWSEPVLFLAYPGIGGVGEFSMTRDGKQIVFIQLSIKGGVGKNDIYYSEKR